MNQIVHCDWLLERARWSHLARSGIPAVSRKHNFPKSHIINPLLTEFVQSRWLDIGLVLFFVSLWMEMMEQFQVLVDKICTRVILNILQSFLHFFKAKYIIA